MVINSTRHFVWKFVFISQEMFIAEYEDYRTKYNMSGLRSQDIVIIIPLVDDIAVILVSICFSRKTRVCRISTPIFRKKEKSFEFKLEVMYFWTCAPADPNEDKNQSAKPHLSLRCAAEETLHTAPSKDWLDNAYILYTHLIRVFTGCTCSNVHVFPLWPTSTRSF